MRSKALCFSNTLASLYSICLLWIFSNAIIASAEMGFVEFWEGYFNLLFSLVGYSDGAAEWIIAIIILLVLHCVCFILGTLLGWIGYARKKSGPASAGAVLYLIGTICFPIAIIHGIIITIFGFIGRKKQKKSVYAQTIKC